MIDAGIMRLPLSHNDRNGSSPARPAGREIYYEYNRKKEKKRSGKEFRDGFDADLFCKKIFF